MRVSAVAFRSWLDPEGGRYLAGHLRRRLEAKFAGALPPGLFLTLTYAPKPGESPLALYRRQSEERHVRRFMEKLRRAFPTWTGEYLRKMEFHKDGRVHFHVLVVGAPRMPHAQLTDLWGHGYVWVRGMTRRAIQYVTKYVSKAGGVPPWLWEEPTRSVKLISVSPGFWGVPSPLRDDVERFSLRGVAWRTLRDAKAAAEERTVVETPVGFSVIRAPLVHVMAALEHFGVEAWDRRGGWMRYAVRRSTLQRFERWAGDGTPRSAASGGPLHLNQKQDPPSRLWELAQAVACVVAGLESPDDLEAVA